VLGVSPDATDRAIRDAYRWLARKFHPDQNVEGDARADAMMKRVNVAYGVLADPIERRAYDRLRTPSPQDAPPREPPKNADVPPAEAPKAAAPKRDADRVADVADVEDAEDSAPRVEPSRAATLAVRIGWLLSDSRAGRRIVWLLGFFVVVWGLAAAQHGSCDATRSSTSDPVTTRTIAADVAVRVECDAAEICSGTVGAELSSALAFRAKTAHKCYDEALGQDSTLKGQVVINVRVSNNGTICSAGVQSSDLANPSVAACIANRFRQGARLPSPTGGCAEVNVPMRLLPPH
jgi:hypothetical protein